MQRKQASKVCRSCRLNGVNSHKETGRDDAMTNKCTIRNPNPNRKFGGKRNRTKRKQKTKPNKSIKKLTSGWWYSNGYSACEWRWWRWPEKAFRPKRAKEEEASEAKSATVRCHNDSRSASTLSKMWRWMRRWLTTNHRRSAWLRLLLTDDAPWFLF